MLTALAYDKGPFAIRYPKESSKTYAPSSKFSPIPVGRKFVLQAVFTSPFTERMFAERVFISGQ